MIAVLDHHERGLSLGFAREPFRVFCRNDAIQATVHNEKRTCDVLRDTLKGQRICVFSRLVLGLAMAAYAESLAGEVRKAIPGLSPVERAAEGNAGLDALVECSGARGIITSEADAPHTHPLCIKVVALLDEIDHGSHRHFVVAADGEIVLSLALSGAFEHERRNSARKERRLVGVAFLLGR